MRKLLLIIVAFGCSGAMAQNKMTPELLWKLGRVSGLGISKDGKYVLYSVSTPNADENKSSRKTYMMPVAGGDAMPVTNADSLLNNEKISADGKYMISEIILSPVLTIHNEEDKDKATRILQKSEAACLISNSIRSKIIFNPQICVFGN